MSEWKSFCLGDVCDFSKDKVAVSALNLRNYISTENLLPNKGGVTEAASLPKVVTTTSFDVDDILISNIRPYFKKIWRATFSGGCSNDVLVIRAKKNVEPRFLYYVLSEDKFFDLVTATAKGTKMPRGDKQVIMNYPVPDFPLETQKKIAAVLSALDDKIELNNAINKNLEEQLNRVYDKIFQSTKKIIELGAVIKTTSGGTPSRKNSSFYKDGQICWVKSKELSGKYIIDTEEKINEIALKNSSAKILPEHSVLIAMYGATVGEYGIISKPMTCNQAVCALIANEQYPFSYLYQIAKESKSYFLNMAVGSAQQNISQILIKQLPVHDDILRIKKFHSFAAPIHGILKNLQTENKKLGEIRDLLLPRLMSGEIDVSEVEI